MRNTTVVVKTCKEYDNNTIAEVLKSGFDLLGGLSLFIKPGNKVLIKPDLYNSTEPNIAKTTNPYVVSALAELIAKIGANCIIADSPKGNFNQSTLDHAYVKTQMLQASNNGNATLSTNDNLAVVTNQQGEHCRDIYIIDAINDADVIVNVGKLRCDKHLGLIGCTQNLFGLIPGKFKTLIKSRCYTLKSYYNYIVDLYETLENKIVINVLDAIVGNESNNDPRILNTLLIGENPYTVDATALKIINANPDESILLKESARRNKFDFKFATIGDNVESLVCNDFNYINPNKNVRSGSTRSFKSAYNRVQKRPIVPSKLCKGCKVCANNCPMKAINIKSAISGDYAEVDYNKCISCFKCVDSCPYKIITTKTPLGYKSVDKMIKKSKSSKN